MAFCEKPLKLVDLAGTSIFSCKLTCVRVFIKYLSKIAFAVFIFAFLTSPLSPGNVSSTTPIFHVLLGVGSVSKTRSPSLRFSLFRYHLFLDSKSGAKYFSQQCQNYSRTRFFFCLRRNFQCSSYRFDKTFYYTILMAGSWDITIPVKP